MSDKNNDIFLLNNNPKELVLKYIPIIENLVVKKLINPGYSLYQDKDDKVQEVVEGLLKDIEKIRKSYNVYSKFSSYFIQIIKNRCNEIRRKEFRQETREIINDNPDNPGFEKKVVYTKRNIVSQITNNNIPGDSNETDKNLIINSELEYLDLVFRLHPLRKVRLLICLKILTGHKVSEEELKTYINYCSQDVYDTLVGYSEQSGSNTKERGYRFLTEFFNSCDKTSNKKDAIRKEVDKMLADIIMLLNRDSGTPVYDKENIWGLIDLYLEKKRKNIS